MQHRPHLIDTASMRDDECEVHAPAPAECATEIGADDPPGRPTLWYAIAAVAVVAFAALIAMWIVSTSTADVAFVTSAWI